MKQYQIVLYVKAYSDTGKESDIVESAIESVEDGIIEGWDSAWEEGSVRMYVVGQDRDSKFYYVHQLGYAWIPVFGSITCSRAKALKMAAAYSGFTSVREYREALRRGQRRA